jgi:integrase
MTEHVYRPTRMKGGKRIQSRLFYGRYSLGRGERPRTVALQTVDIRVARAKLRKLIIEKQSERLGLIAPQAIRDAAETAFPELLRHYLASLLSTVTRLHAQGSCRRIERAAKGAGWRVLGDVTPLSWVKWLSTLTCAAKTRKEYQTSVMAFLNWLGRTKQIAANPLAGIDKVEIRGKMVRPVRAFTDDEIRRLLSIAGRRRSLYLLLLYTGLRRNEARSLVWDDVKLDAPRPYLLAREGTTKNGIKRPVPLHQALAQVLAVLRPLPPVDASMRSLWPVFPKHRTLMADLLRAGIEHQDKLGRVVHFHAFRKTFQTLGVRSGVNQRAAQELLGHSDPSLTANVYTDVAALNLHSEVAKLPWLGDAAENALKTTATAASSLGKPEKVKELILELLSALNLTENQALTESEKWGGLRDSNPRPLESQSSALTN